MLLKCFLIFALIFYLEAASISKEIPVNVVYVEPEEIQENARGKTQMRYLQNRNLDEKIQLSSRELKEASQHIPIQAEPEKNDGKLFFKAKTVFLEKLSTFKEQVEGFKVKSNQKKPSAEDWTRLNEKLQEIFKKYEVSDGLRQSQGGFLAELTQATGNWFQSLGGNNNNPTGQEDEQPANQGGLGQIWNNFQASVGQAFSNLTNNNNNNSNNQESTTSNTVLGDTGVVTSTKAPGIFQQLVSVFNNNNNNNNQGNKPGQEDTGASSPPNIFQGAISNFFNTLNPSTEKPSNAQGDTGVITSSTSAPGNQIINNIGNAISSMFGQSTKPPGASGDNGVENRPPNFFENFGNIIGGVLNQNQVSSTVATQYSEGTTSAPNIIQQGIQQFQIPGPNGTNLLQQFQNTGQQNFVNQAQNVGQQIIPGSSGNNQIAQITEGFQNPQNFASQAQNIGQQISGGNQFQQIGESFQKPQNFATQAQNIGQQISGNLPSGSQNPVQQISEAFQNPQNFASQAQNIGQQLSGNLQQNNDSGSNFQTNVSNLNINQVPVIGQQLNQNSQNPLQNIGDQFQSNVINQIQSSTNQIQNPAGSNNPLNLIDTQNQQVNVNQLNQVIPSNPQSGNGIQSTLTNQFTNGVSQLNPQTGTSNFVSAVSNPVNAASQFLQNNQQSSSEQSNSVKPVTEEKVDRKAVEIESQKSKNTGEAEILLANP